MAVHGARPRGRQGLALAAVGLVLLSACRVKLDVATEVEEDGSGEVAVTLLLGKTVRETLSEGGLVTDDPEALRKALESGDADALRAPDLPDPVDVLEKDVPAGWRSERIDDGELQGLRLRAQFNGVDDIPELLDTLNSWGEELAGRAGYDIGLIGVSALTEGFALTREGSFFRFRAEPIADAYAGATGGSNNLRAELTLSLKLPGGVQEHNADEEKDGTLTWRIPPGESRSISATSDLKDDPSSFPLTPVAVAVAAGVGLFGLWVWRRRRGPADESAEPPDTLGLRDDEPVPV